MTEELSRYKDLEIETEGMWSINTTTLPVVLGVLGLSKKSMEKYISKIHGNIKIKQVQRCAPLGIALILRTGFYPSNKSSYPCEIC